MQRTLWVAGELETEDLAAADVVVDRSAKDVHGVTDTSRSMEQSTSGDLRVTAGFYDRPRLGVQVIAEETGKEEQMK